MADKTIPSADFLRQIFDYNPETGELRWKPKTPDMFNDGGWWKYRPEEQCKRWNARRGNKIATRNEQQGYATVFVSGRLMKAHRVIWCMMTGEFPKGQIDHINGIRDDNRWSNLRDVPKIVNALNQRRHRTNKSGVTGVRYMKHTGKYGAYIGHNNKIRHLGSFSSFDDAVAARLKAEKELGYHPNHGNTVS